VNSVLLLQTGGLGDLVLGADVVGWIKARYPDAAVTLACRAELAALARLFPVAPDALLPLRFRPEMWTVPGADLVERLEGLAAELGRRRDDLILDLTLKPTWLLPLVAALAGVERVIAATSPGGALVDRLLDRFHLQPRQIQVAEAGPAQSEWARYRALVTAAGIPAGAPLRWRRPDHGGAEAWLARHGLSPGTYLVCFPGGTPSTPIKRWPAERYLALLSGLPSLPVLVLGEAAERSELERFAAGLERRPVAGLAGAPEDLPLAAALVAAGRAYLGNDTGPAHLAQAYCVPGVTIHGGGGEWPRYAAWAPGSISLVHPLPCFGCGWDCVLGEALCVESIPVEAVGAALHAAMDRPDAPPRVVSLDRVEPGARRLLAAASSRYRAAQQDRAARLDVIVALEPLRDRLAAAEHQTAEQAEAAAARLAELWAIDAEARRRAVLIDELTAAVSEREGRIAALEQAATSRVRAFQICTGLGAGNIGDDLMAEAFWDKLPSRIALEVARFPEAARRRGFYPVRHRYVAVDWPGDEGACGEVPGLLVGGTPVAEAEGLDWPLRFLARRLVRFHRKGLPVDAVGIGVDRLASAEARRLFADGFAEVRSWTVRSQACRAALVDLGVDAARIRVGADWAWLHQPRRSLAGWANGYWRYLGIDPGRPLLVANPVNMLWRDREEPRRALGAALAAAAKRFGLQLAFFCNECRDGEFYDAAAARDIAALTPHPTVLVPNEYFAPDEAVALLRSATATVGQRYHFVVESVLAGAVPIMLARGQKMAALAAELGLEPAGTVEAIDRDRLAEAIAASLDARDRRLARQEHARRALADRAAGNLDLLRRQPPYDAADWGGGAAG